jgi:Xaa-Pro aminopeptidase
MTPPLSGFDFPALAEQLGRLGADAWLLYDFRGVNPVANHVLGIHGMGTRRYFVLLPRAGTPIAVAHRIELASFEGFPGEIRQYSAWRELHAQLGPLLAGKTVAMEVSTRDAVPYLDRVPHGVVQLVEHLGARVVSSAPLVTRFAARWTAEELAGHRRAAEALAQIAQEALRWAGAELARGGEVRETTVQRRVALAFERAGLVADHPPIVGFQANSANPHYEPREGADRRLQPGDVLLLDLWAGPALGTVFA